MNRWLGGSGDRGRRGNAKEDATKKVSVRETIARSCAPINTRMINFCNASVTPTPPSGHLLHAPFMGLDAVRTTDRILQLKILLCHEYDEATWAHEFSQFSDT